MIFGSLFSGIGGFDLGFERAGMECVWQVEIDKDCQRVLTKQFPNVERFEDVTTIKEFPAVDVICGGFPCQDLSVAGKRAGLAGERSGLWFEFLRVIATNLPEWVVVENVPGMMSAEGDNDVPFRCVCGWTDRWRGMHIPESERSGESEQSDEERFLRQSRDWDDASGEACSDGTASSVRRVLRNGPRGDREVVRVVALETSGRTSSNSPASTASALGYKKAASRVGGNGRSDPKDADSKRTNTSPLDSAITRSSKRTARAGNGTQPKGPINPGRAKTVCPACGRCLDDSTAQPIRGNAMGTVLRGLASVGYDLAWSCMDAQWFGVAQRRRRMFIVGHLRARGGLKVFPFPEGLQGNPPTRGEAGPRVAPCIDGSPYADREAEHGRLVIPIQEVGARESKNQNGAGIGIGKDQDVMYTLQSGQVHGVAAASIYHENIDGKVYESHESPALRNFQKDAPMVVTHALRSEGADASEDGTGRGTPLVVAEAVDVRNLRMQPDGTSGTLQHKKSGGYSLNYQNPICFSSKDHGADAGEIAPTLRSQNFKDSHINGGGQVAIAFQQDATDKFSEDVTPTMRGKSNGGTRAFGVAAEFGVRRLTPQECERLQGFPDDWTLYDANGKEISDSARYRMLGNAVAVPVAEWIGKRLIEAIRA